MVVDLLSDGADSESQHSETALIESYLKAHLRIAAREEQSQPLRTRRPTIEKVRAKAMHRSALPCLSSATSPNEDTAVLGGNLVNIAFLDQPSSMLHRSYGEVPSHRSQVFLLRM
jgi:hypothetical protein